MEPHIGSSRALNELIETHSLCDLWRDLNSNARQYTWVHTRENFISLASLDRFYCFKHHVGNGFIHSCHLEEES